MSEDPNLTQRNDWVYP